MRTLLPSEPGKAQRPTKHFMRQLEMEALEIRRRLKVGPLDQFDPRSFAKQLGLQLAYPTDLPDLQPSIRDQLCSLEPTVWSGMGKKLPDGLVLVLLNPNMTVERETVTIMEEFCHVYYGHEPSDLVVYPLGFAARKYDESVEQEAYWTGAAVLLPAKAVALSVWRGETADDLAVRYSVSPQLAEMRIKTLGLWPHYDPDSSVMRKAS
jgi:hypothetical protein